MIKKLNLLGMNKDQLQNFLLSINEKKFKANQIMKWVYKYFCDDFNKMTNLSKKLREKLNDKLEISGLKIIEEHHSSDGTIKWSMSVKNQKIETVCIPYNNRTTICISSQVGCMLRCSFCSTAKQGFNRNLQTSEIIGQIWTVAKNIYFNKIKNNHINNKITNVVIMGMGEPLLNLSNIITAIQIMLDSFCFGFSKRHITLSTAGIVPAIKKLEGILDIVLAISLHAPNDTIRNNIMPINLKYKISDILSAAKSYVKKSKANQKRVTIEYVMIKDINDHIYDAHQLAFLLKKIPCKINLIPWNSFPYSLYKCSTKNQINVFSKILINYGFTVTIRDTRGSDINAACGQLVGKVFNRFRNTDSEDIKLKNI